MARIETKWVKPDVLDVNVDGTVVRIALSGRGHTVDIMKDGYYLAFFNKSMTKETITTFKQACELFNVERYSL